ncbi:lipopolysaccharide biosynthesis protein [Novosphingobium sp. HR1a]|nr:oligosaccharide flippase family protein [Novosphingobium sp. HR1a]
MSAMMSALAKLVSVGTALLTVPLALHYLGVERYGMWMILSSLVAMLSFADLGIGNGILNTVAAAHGREDRTAMREGISSGFFVLSMVAALILLVFALFYRHVAWHEFFNVRSLRARAEAGPAIAAFVMCFAVAIPAGVVQRVQMGLQQGFIANLWQCGGSVLALIAVLTAIYLRAGLPWLVIAFLSGPLAANIVNSIVFFWVLRSDIRPSWAMANKQSGLNVIRTGLLFLLLQVAAAITYNSDNVIIAQLLGSASVPLYAVPERLFSLITMTATMALSPLWPAYRESIARGDVEWARRTLMKSLKVAIGYAAVLAICLMILGPWIIRLWVGEAVKPPILLILGLGLWKIVEAGGLALGMFLNGAHVVKTQVVFTGLTAVVSITAEIILVKQIGVAGAVWGTFFAFSLFSILPYALLTPKLLRVIERQNGAIK